MTNKTLRDCEIGIRSMFVSIATILRDDTDDDRERVVFALDDASRDCYIFLSTFPERSTVITLDEMMERRLARASFFSLFRIRVRWR